MPTMTAATDALVTFGQDVWWRNREGITILIDSMDHRYRHNVANYLMDRAAMFAEIKWRRDWWTTLFTAGSYDGDGGDPLDEDAYSVDAEDRMVYRRLNAGEHIDWLKSTKLYQRMAA